MKLLRRAVCALLILILSLSLWGCGGTRTAGYEVIARLDSEEFSIAFRNGDPTCDIVSAALEEMAAEGLLSRLSMQYLGADYSSLEGNDGALMELGVEIPADRRLLVGVMDGAAPLCSRDENTGSFVGLIPDMVSSLAEKTGWEIVYMPISSENVDVELASGNVDCAWLPAAHSASANYSLSPGWMENSHLLIVRKGSGLNKIRDLKNHNVGITDTTAENALKDNTKIFDSLTLWNYGNIKSCFTALAAGECDAVVIDSIVSSHYLP
ncbi:MAG: transporter substrate-binding domain-containing protein [Oscillospiraceae bacterium]|nr:transporter substrate-binding domain-containing protein [Oscillospiraceae bacterium]